jgi:NTE family protein
MRGLVLTAGGARGAYQAGVLRRIGEIAGQARKESPFPIVAGASAGAINGALVGAGSADLRASTRKLAQIWSELSFADVVKVDPLSLGKSGVALLRDLSLGAVLGGAGLGSLLDAAPLRTFLARHFRPAGIARAIRAGTLHAVALSATSYHSGRSFTFIQGAPGHATWTKRRRVALPAQLTIDHVLASASIPLVFPPVRVGTDAGELWFGDGALRLVSPLSPAIRLGASEILAIGVRCSSSAEQLSDTELQTAPRARRKDTVTAQPPLAQICGVFLNAIFLDHLDADLDHLLRMNELVAAHAGTPRDDAGPSEPMRVVKALVVNPSEDLALVASHFAHRMPRAIRFLMDGLGTPDARSADLMSYLLFDSAYTRTLVEIGYRDADKRSDEIEAFLSAA